MDKKFCNGCKKDVPVSDYHMRTVRGRRCLRTRCKPCFVKSIRKIQQRKRTRAKRHLGARCQRCGYDTCLDALDFHHVGEKKETISTMYKSQSYKKILKEIENCILVCANCHREIHAGLPE